MTDRDEGGRIRDPLEEGEDKASRLTTSGNREESMTESGKDAFGKGSAVRNPDSAETQKTNAPGGQSPTSSGTESLGGETKTTNDHRGPGGVEGTE